MKRATYVDVAVSEQSDEEGRERGEDSLKSSCVGVLDVSMLMSHGSSFSTSPPSAIMTLSAIVVYLIATRMLFEIDALIAQSDRGAWSIAPTFVENF